MLAKRNTCYRTYRFRWAMNEGVKKKAAGAQPGRGFTREASLKDKRTHLDLIEVHISQLAEELNHGNQKALQQVLDVFGAGRKCARWTYWNLLGLLRQRPDLQRPVTIREAAEVGHYLKRGVVAQTSLAKAIQ